MNSESATWVGVGLLAVSFGLLVAFGASGGAVAALAILGIVLFAYVGWSMRKPVDASWLARWVILGFIAKLGGTFARYWMVVVFYGGGDSGVYYRVGTELAVQWRSGQIPSLTGERGFGTQNVEWITGALFALFTPDMLGGFLMFSFLSFFGQLMLYAAIRYWAKPHQLKPYAFFVFFLPTFAFWPSSIGKDALVILGLGGAAYFVARALQAFEVRWLLGLALSLGWIGLMRIHVAGLVVGTLVIATAIARLPARADGGAGARRVLVLAASIAASLLVLTLLPSVFGGIDTSSLEGLEAFGENVADRTSGDGTVASGGPVSSPIEIPEAVALVLFRPFLFEATEIQHVAAAAETTFLLLLTVWKLPAMWRNRREWRRNGYVVFSTIYVLTYAVAFSVIRNMGIVARQRGQVLGFFLVVVVALGWEERKKAVLLPQLTPAPPASYVR